MALIVSKGNLKSTIRLLQYALVSSDVIPEDVIKRIDDIPVGCSCESQNGGRGGGDGSTEQGGLIDKPYA